MAIDAPPHPERAPEAPAPRSARGPFALITVAALLVAAVGVIAFLRDDGGDTRPPAPTWRGATVEPARSRPSFTLTGTDGQPYDFAARTAGQLTFLFFGYTNCPDVCPISMATLTQALHDLPGVGAQVVFVTTDPSRDTPERLQEWLGHFEGKVVGLTGTPEQLAAAQQAAGATVAIAEQPDAGGSYTVGHSAAMNVYTPDDLQHLSYPAGTVQSDWMADIPRILAQPGWNGAGSVRVTAAYASPGTGGAGAAYLSVTNTGGDDAIVGITSPDAAAAELHVTSGTTMREATELALPAGATVQLAPGGDHVMLSGLTRELAEGDTITLVVHFREAPATTVQAAVVSYDDLAGRMAQAADAPGGGS